MTTVQGQDIISCCFCPNSVEHHCNPCHIGICNECVSSHLADKSREHEVVDYKSRKKDTLAFSFCNTHEENQCATFCKTCGIPVCHDCITGSHKGHAFIGIKNIIEKYKSRIKADTHELQNIIVPKFTEVGSLMPAAEFGKILSEIKDQEDKMCEAVHQEAVLLRELVNKQKKEAEGANEENTTLVENTEKELNAIMQKNNSLLRSSDATAIINYKPFDPNLRKGPQIRKIHCPNFSPSPINQHQIRSMFGSLQFSDVSNRQSGILKMMDSPTLLETIQSPYGKSGKKLWQVKCIGKDEILTSGNGKTLKKISKSGSIIDDIITKFDISILSTNVYEEPVFTAASLHDTKVYVYSDGKVGILLELGDWYPRGICHTKTRDLLVSMRSKDWSQCKVVLYSGKTQIQVIQYDREGRPLFSTSSRSQLRLTENGNGDICVADYSANAVKVGDSFGELRFKYLGNISTSSEYMEFQPSDIAADINHQILISDFANNIIHIIDCDGKFLRYIKRPCSAGISINTDDNLVLGEYYTGKIRIIKYLE
ncbi:uncharacterized protein LOC133195101 [Saccostrea echinata]|uniref:uncharacterized protein LOC133195101 n=1 Tax=Saccostrea echinata TaxID=191078 RepID=UPI002A7ECA67|nr:uncharacterized protein LOC133195101 [Saccostrea echinata]